jgi:uncharacterized membrane protein YccF (DUF307 family)
MPDNPDQNQPLAAPVDQTLEPIPALALPPIDNTGIPLASAVAPISLEAVAPYVAPQPPALPIQTVVVAPTPRPTVTFSDTRGGPNILIRIVWFVFVGWWASLVFITLALLVTYTIVGIPIGIWLLNRIPQVTTLKLDKTMFTVRVDAEGNTDIRLSQAQQRVWWQRTLWFVLVGWWLTAFWLYAAWILCLTVIGMAIAFPMFGFTGKILTLKRG